MYEVTKDPQVVCDTLNLTPQECEQLINQLRSQPPPGTGTSQQTCDQFCISMTFRYGICKDSCLSDEVRYSLQEECLAKLQKCCCKKGTLYQTAIIDPRKNGELVKIL